jgi:phospholipid/cholesterol/gamma-HCH transport system substrate-binding protein/paraquat-inducible protein B
MDDKQHYLRLGVFVIVTVAIAFAALFVLGGRNLFQTSVTVETYFDDSVAGLEVGAPVTFRGVPLGRVSEIRMAVALYQTDVPVDQRKGYVVVRAKITDKRADVWERDLAQLIGRGLRFQTQLAGVTGQQYLALDFHDPKRYPPLPFDWTPDYPYVPSAPSLAGQIVANAQRFLASLDGADLAQLGQNLNALAVTLNQKVDEVPVQELASEASAVLKAARATIDRLDRVLAQAPIDETVRNLNTASARIDRLLADPALKQTVDDAAAVAARLRRITDSGDLDRIVKSLDQTIQRADAMLGNNQYDVRGIVQDLRVTADNLRTLSEVAKRYPAGLLTGGPPPKVQLPKEVK